MLVIDYVMWSIGDTWILVITDSLNVSKEDVSCVCMTFLTQRQFFEVQRNGFVYFKRI